MITVTVELLPSQCALFIQTPDTFTLMFNRQARYFLYCRVCVEPDWCCEFRRSSQVLVHSSVLELLVFLPVRLWAASRRGQQKLSAVALRALRTSQQRHHDLAHVSVEDVSFVGPLGQVEGCGKSRWSVRAGNVFKTRIPSYVERVISIFFFFPSRSLIQLNRIEC